MATQGYVNHISLESCIWVGIPDVKEKQLCIILYWPDCLKYMGHRVRMVLMDDLRGF